MSRRLTIRVRFLVVAILATLALGFALSTTQAQFSRPPGGISGMRPGMPGGISGMPVRPPGGISGIGGMPGSFSGTPKVFGEPFGGPRGEMVWRCGKCKGELGRGPVDPGQAVCPYCGVQFSGGRVRGPGSFAPFAEMPSAPPPAINNPTFPASTNSPQEMPPLAPRSDGSARGDLPRPVPNATTTPSGGDSSGSSSDDASDSGRTWKIVGLVVASVFFLLIVTMLIVVVSNSSNRRPVRRRRLSLDDN